MESNQDLAARLQRLEDIRAIEVLKARYVRACDRKQPDEVRRCFTDDARIDFEGFPLFSDPDSFVDIYREWGCRPNIIDMHHMQNPIVEITGPDSARGWFDLYFFQIDTETHRHTQLAVSYDDEFRRVGGEWKIVHSVSRRMSTIIRELGNDGIEHVLAAGRSDRDEPPAPPR